MSGKVALCLAAAARLQMSFNSEPNPALKRILLDTAADFIDKTAPAAGAESELALRRHANKTLDQVSFLVEAAHLMRPVSEYGWPVRRVRPNQWPAEYASALRALEQVLKQSTCPPQGVQALMHWLAPVWNTYPQLQDPCTRAATTK